MTKFIFFLLAVTALWSFIGTIQRMSRNGALPIGNIIAGLGFIAWAGANWLWFYRHHWWETLIAFLVSFFAGSLLGGALERKESGFLIALVGAIVSSVASFWLALS